MKSNPLLKWLLIPMALVLLFVGIKMFSGDRGAKPVPAGSANSLTPEEMKALGIEGDTPRDTVATLVALAYHAWVGMREIFMDYIKSAGLRLVLQVFVLVWLVGCLGWGLQVLWRL